VSFHSRRTAALPLASAIAVLLSSCAGAAGAGSSSGSARTPTGMTGPVVVFAAASLTQTFTQLGKEFQARHPGTRVTFSFGASSTLAQQIVQGAPADVFASASPTNMAQVVAAKHATSPRTFARNVMEIAVPTGNPARVAGLADLGRPSVKVVLCQPQVPCGSTAGKVFAKAKVVVRPVSLEADVKATLTKVELGEADAGVVYVTDVLSAGPRVRGVPIPAMVNASTTYPIATLTGSTHAAAARAFVDFVLSDEAAGVLAAAGFQRP
jgi:molybdate transport system substrate-binding protein